MAEADFVNIIATLRTVLIQRAVQPHEERYLLAEVIDKIAALNLRRSDSIEGSRKGREVLKEWSRLSSTMTTFKEDIFISEKCVAFRIKNSKIGN